MVEKNNESALNDFWSRLTIKREPDFSRKYDESNLALRSQEQINKGYRGGTTGGAFRGSTEGEEAFKTGTPTSRKSREALLRPLEEPSTDLLLARSFRSPTKKELENERQKLNALATKKRREVNPDAIDPDTGEIDYINTDEETRWLGWESPSFFVNRSKAALGVPIDDPNYLGTKSDRSNKAYWDEWARDSNQELDPGLNLSHFKDDRLYHYIAKAEFNRTGLREGFKDKNGNSVSREEIINNWDKEQRGRYLDNVLSHSQQNAVVDSYNTRQKLDAYLADVLWNNHKGSLVSPNLTAEEKIKGLVNGVASVALDPTTIFSAVVGRGLSVFTGKKIINNMAAKHIQKFDKRFKKKYKIKKEDTIEDGINNKTNLSKDAKNMALLEYSQLSKKITNKVISRATKAEEKRIFWGVTGADVVGTATIEATGAGYANYIGQLTEMELGSRNAISKGQVGILAAFGALGGGPIVATNMIRRGGVIENVKHPLIYDNYLNLKKLEDNKFANLNMQEAVDNVPAETWEKLIERIQGNTLVLSSFADKAKRGERVFYTQTGEIVEDELQFYDLFFKGDKSLGIRGILDIFEDYGIGYSKGGRGKLIDADGLTYQDNFSNWTGDLMLALPENVGKELQTMFDESLGKLGIERFEGKTIKEFVDLDATRIRGAARVLQQRGEFRNIAYVDLEKGSSPQEAIKKALDVPGPSNWKRLVTDANIFQAGYVRGLISHIGTTALNIKGWQWSTSTQTAADTVKMGLYMGRSGLELLAMRGDKAGEYATKAKNLLRSNGLKMRSLWEADTTYAEMNQVFEANPEAVGDLVKYFIGGVDNNPTQMEKGFFVGETLKKADGKFFDYLQVASGAKAVDVFTKFVELNYGLNKFALDRYGMTHRDLLNSPDVVRILQSEEYAQGMLQAADQAAKNTWSKKYGVSAEQGGTILQQIALGIEGVRRIPILGIELPFGQFFNNTIAYMVEHSPIGPIKYLIDKSMGNINPKDGNKFIDHLSKSVVGTSIIMHYADSDQMAMDIRDGLSWKQGRDRDGNIIDKAYKFPEIFFKGMGRLIAYGRMGVQPSEKELSEIANDVREAINDPDRDLYSLTNALFEAGGDVQDKFPAFMQKEFYQSIPKELLLDVSTQLGPANLFRGLDKTFVETGKALVDVLTGQRPLLQSFLNGVQNVGAKAVAGRYRSFDMLDGFIELQQDDPVTRYKSGDSKHYWTLITYTDNILNSMFDTQQAPVKRSPFRYRELKSKWSNAYLNAPPSSFERIMNDVGYSNWRAGMPAKFKEVGNTLNGYLWDVLERKAAVILATETYIQAKTPEQRLKLVKAAVASAQTEVRSEITKEFSEKSDYIKNPTTGAIVKERTHDEGRRLYLLMTLGNIKGVNLRQINKEVNEAENFDGEPLYVNKDTNKRIKNVYDLSNAQLNNLIIQFDTNNTLEAIDIDKVKKN